jgi:RNA polymerase sigma-70 factor, ECF subfamily
MTTPPRKGLFTPELPADSAADRPLRSADEVRPAAAARSTESTFRLLDRARDGDRAAADELFHRYGPPLRRWASGRLPRFARDISDTADLVQETLLQTFRRLGEFRPQHPGALQAYLRQALLNKIRDELRRCARWPKPEELAADLPQPGRSPLEIAIGRESVERYEAALQRLRPVEREVIIGRIEMGYTWEELAETTGKASAGAARQATQRALLRLVEEMERGS